ncbi:MAG: MBL fold metallo-hydrolase [Burkholderiales bacterium]|nr:MBL fold metallo-hydrolase [Burkholderiales bacterium]
MRLLLLRLLPLWGLCLLGAVPVTTHAACPPRIASSPQADGECGFRNSPNPQAQPSRSGWEIWTRFIVAKKEGTVPVDPIPVRRLDRAALEALDGSGAHIVRLGHSSHLLKLQGRYWLIDPMFSERASPLSFAGPKRFHPPPLSVAELPPVDGLILSHDHYDHLDSDTIQALHGKVQRYFVPLGVGARLQAMGVPAERIEEFDWWQASRHGGIGITATPAQHFSGRGLTDRNSTLWASWVIDTGAQRIFFSGDTGYFPGFREIGERAGPFDVALMENGAYDAYWPAMHLMPEETVQAFVELRARLLWLVHNSTFDLAFHTWRDPLDRVAALAEARGLPLATPEIGEVVTLGQPRVNRLWWKGLR